ncbi:hypothetical protein GCM10027048_31830 [Hymenobacter coalescens]
MKAPKIVTHAGLTLDLSQVKCLKLSPFTSSENESGQLVVEYRTRTDYVWHPGTQQWESLPIAEVIRYDFPSYESAQAYVREWEALWQDYLDEHAH